MTKKKEKNMTLAQLRYVITVSQIGTLSEAAKRLYISQPSLTNAIKELSNGNYNVRVVPIKELFYQDREKNF